MTENELKNKFLEIFKKLFPNSRYIKMETVEDLVRSFDIVTERVDYIISNNPNLKEIPIMPEEKFLFECKNSIDNLRLGIFQPTVSVCKITSYMGVRLNPTAFYFNPYDSLPK